MTSCCSEDCPVKYGWCPPQINTAAKEFRSQLEDLKSIFYLALERYNNSYPPRMADPTEENMNLYSQSENQLDETFSDLFILESSVEAASNSINGEIQDETNNINNLKARYDKDHARLDTIRNTNLASYPMKREFEQFRFQTYIDLAYYIVGILIVIYIFVKAIVPNKVMTITLVPADSIARLSRASALKPFASPKVAKITAASAAIIAAILAAYYG